MRVGILCEGEMTDGPVLREILLAIFPAKLIVVFGPKAKANDIQKADVLIRGLSKKQIFLEGDVWLNDMLDRGMERVLIIWDLLPIGHKMGVSAQKSDKPSRKEQREMLLSQLCESTKLQARLKQQAEHHALRYQFRNTPVNHPNGGNDLFKLVCVCYTLDGWFLADTDILCDLASTPEHKAVKWKNPPMPDECPHPEFELENYFGRCANKWFRHYNKHDHNLAITKEYIKRKRLNAMRISQSFSYALDILGRWI